ncbi:cupin domain-containing protein [soil metagenome]
MQKSNQYIILVLIASITVTGESKMANNQEPKKPFHGDIIDIVKKNDFFRKEVITGNNSQVVVMSIPAGGDIGEETHPSIDQTFFFVQGHGSAIINGKSSDIAPNHLIFVPAGTKHNFKNTGTEALKLFTIYAPPQHKPGTVQKDKPKE